MPAKNQAAYIQVDPSLEESRASLGKFAKDLDDFRPFWRALWENLADTAQARWPLKRRSGRLRRSLRWAAQRLGRDGIFQSRPNRLVFGSRIFYADFSQRGTKYQTASALIHVDQADIGARLDAWARSRAEASGLEAEDANR